MSCCLCSCGLKDTNVPRVSKLLASLSLIVILLTPPAWSMGLRSFVALPLEEGGVVLRGQDIGNFSKNSNVAIGEVAYGLSGTQTLIMSMPYRLKPDQGGPRQGDLSAIYRQTVWKQDFHAGTNRLALLAGGLLPTNNKSDGSVQLGGVTTFYKDRQEIDIDALWIQGFGRSPNQGRYTISWQYRLWPSKYPKTGLGQNVNLVLEYNGRWRQGTHLIHQGTVGLQWILPTFVIEGGIFRDINQPHHTHWLISLRYHL